MELISGKTLDELIERAPLTWPDFRELAIQTQEALIAAQELGLIHSDIKPSNLMLTWLPSGKFQMKIVDFGLATLDPVPVAGRLAGNRGRLRLDLFHGTRAVRAGPARCPDGHLRHGLRLLSGAHRHLSVPGETGHEVMVSHLHHKVIPIQELRADIPLWACDWIMWMINRMPADRPESAREALQVFFQNDKNPKPTMSLGKAHAGHPAGPPRPPGHPRRRPTTQPRQLPPNGSSPIREWPLPDTSRPSWNRTPDPSGTRATARGRSPRRSHCCHPRARSPASTPLPTRFPTTFRRPPRRRHDPRPGQALHRPRRHRRSKKAVKSGSPSPGHFPQPPRIPSRQPDQGEQGQPALQHHARGSRPRTEPPRSP